MTMLYTNDTDSIPNHSDVLYCMLTIWSSCCLVISMVGNTVGMTPTIYTKDVQWTHLHLWTSVLS